MKDLSLPAGIRLLHDRNGLRFQGTAVALRALSRALRPLAEGPDHTAWRVHLRQGADWKLVSQEQYPVLRRRMSIVLPPDAWAIISWKILHVSCGWETSPFAFADCGYLRPAPDHDIGFDLLGEPEPID